MYRGKEARKQVDRQKTNRPTKHNKLELMDNCYLPTALVFLKWKRAYRDKQKEERLQHKLQDRPERAKRRNGHDENGWEHPPRGLDKGRLGTL